MPALALLLGLAGPALAQAPAPAVSIGGQVAEPTTVTTDGLASLPAVQVSVPSERGGQNEYVGTMLWPLVAATRPVDGPERWSHLQHVIYAHGADGYTVALAMGEIDPGFEGKPVIIAYKENGALLPAPRLVVPGDHKGGRSVRELVALEIR